MVETFPRRRVWWAPLAGTGETLMMKTTLTQPGANKLREELKRLQHEERPRAIEAVKVAQESPDIQDPSVLALAVEHQKRVEDRIAELEAQLANVEGPDGEGERRDTPVAIEALVTLRVEPDGELICYRIVGEQEADIGAGKLSVSSPVARALLGRVAGESVIVETPGGRPTYHIVQVRYGE